MEEVISIENPGFKATYNVVWSESTEFGDLENVKQVNGIFFNEDGQILIVNPTGNWQLPGGHLEGDESPEEGLKRETHEEADAEIENIKALGHLKVREIKEGEMKPEFIQLYYFGKITKLNKQTPDPEHNRIPERKFIDPSEFTNHVPWGKIGNAIIEKAIKESHYFSE